jgi:Na+/melibiose symporter-like transporter
MSLSTRQEKLLKSLLVSSNWGLFTLGAGQVLFVLIGVIPYIIANGCFAILLVFYFSRFVPDNTLKKSSWAVLVVGGMLIIMTMLYNYFVLLQVSRQLIIVNLVGITLFIITGHLAGLLFKKRYVPE